MSIGKDFSHKEPIHRGPPQQLREAAEFRTLPRVAAELTDPVAQGRPAESGPDKKQSSGPAPRPGFKETKENTA